MISIANLHFAYRRKPVFSGLNLELRPGHIYGLLGRNGMGKSTLLRSIAGFLFPQQGSIDVLGYVPRQRQPAFLQRVFLLPEDFYLPPMALERWVALYSVFYPRFDQEQFRRTAAGFELHTDGRLDQMSYGQRKKALICFALATNAEVLLLDEPTNGLDIVSKGQFRKVMAGAVDENKCIVISTHQIKDLENLIDRVTIIDEGKILFDQTIDAIQERLVFRLSYDPEETAGAIYSEDSFRGSALILPNTAGEDSRPDLEMLYKAVMLRGERINGLFTQKQRR
ncbi:MAG TPA: ABC transporter ATP-binding protein [Puia sp.]|nr:ABC transporter ATP-binding protein [Puia sp.]